MSVQRTNWPPAQTAAAYTLQRADALRREASGLALVVLAFFLAVLLSQAVLARSIESSLCRPYIHAPSHRTVRPTLRPPGMVRYRPRLRGPGLSTATLRAVADKAFPGCKDTRFEKKFPRARLRAPLITGNLQAKRLGTSSVMAAFVPSSKVFPMSAGVLEATCPASCAPASCCPATAGRDPPPRI